jgi:hypothetical protein
MSIHSLKLSFRRWYRCDQCQHQQMISQYPPPVRPLCAKCGHPLEPEERIVPPSKPKER